MEQRPRGCTAVVAAVSGDAGSDMEPCLGLGPRAAKEGGPALLVLLGTQGQGSTPSPGCDCAHNLQKRNPLFCCRGCPAGHYLTAPCTEPCGNITCLPCPQGTFLARENHHETSCARCQACDEEASQVALKNCSAVADTHCGCKPDWFVECLVTHCIGGSPFRCHPCLDCGALHRHTWVSCSSKDTDCGTCLPGFFEYGNRAPSGPVLSPVRQSVAGGRVGGVLGTQVGELGWAKGRLGGAHHPPPTSCFFSVLGPGASGRPGSPTPAWCHPDLHIPPLPAPQAHGSRRWSWDGGPDPPAGKNLSNVLQEGEQAPRPQPSGAERLGFVVTHGPQCVAR
ncbi:tumor necrosis factor receptor superfamily member 25 isoform 3-T3 [Hipposideros larvatus]